MCQQTLENKLNL